MTITVTLNEEEIGRAIQVYLREQGYEVQGQPQLVHHAADSRDPRESSYFQARVEVKQK